MNKLFERVPLRYIFVSNGYGLGFADRRTQMRAAMITGLACYKSKLLYCAGITDNSRCKTS
jgi:hypothetical protein